MKRVGDSNWDRSRARPAGETARRSIRNRKERQRRDYASFPDPGVNDSPVGCQSGPDRRAPSEEIRIPNSPHPPRHIFSKQKKWSRLFSRDHSFISTIIRSCFRLSASTQLNELLRLQFLFVFRRLQSLQLLLPAHPCLPLSLPTSLGRPFHGFRRFLSAF